MEILTNWPAAGLNSKFSYPHINISPSSEGEWPCGPRGDATSAIALNQQRYWIKLVSCRIHSLQSKNHLEGTVQQGKLPVHLIVYANKFSSKFSRRDR